MYRDNTHGEQRDYDSNSSSYDCNGCPQSKKPVSSEISAADIAEILTKDDPQKLVSSLEKIEGDATISPRQKNTLKVVMQIIKGKYKPNYDKPKTGIIPVIQ